MPPKFYNVTVQARNSELIGFGQRPFRNTKITVQIIAKLKFGKTVKFNMD